MNLEPERCQAQLRALRPEWADRVDVAELGWLGSRVTCRAVRLPETSNA